jgi:hypothetical protein
LTAPNSLTRTTAITHPSSTPSIKRALNFSNTVNGFNGTITIYYLDSELNGIAENDLTLNVHTGVLWTHYNTGVTRDALNNFVTTTALGNVNLSELTLASVLAPLPLSWGPVNAIRYNKIADIEWVTYEESNVDLFEIERSIDGIQFTSTGLKTPAYNTTGDHHYRLTDQMAPAGKTFYRVKGMEKNGHAAYSQVAMINAVQSGRDSEVVIYPNPASAEVNVQLASSAQYIRSVQLYSAAGRLLQTAGNLNKTIGTVDITRLAHGMYWLQVELSNGTFIWHSFIKQ